MFCFGTSWHATRSAGCVIRVVAAEIHGSGLVEDINDMFEIDSVNRVGWSERCNPGTGQCEILSETQVSVYLLIPRLGLSTTHSSQFDPYTTPRNSI